MGLFGTLRKNTGWLLSGAIACDATNVKLDALVIMGRAGILWDVTILGLKCGSLIEAAAAIPRRPLIILSEWVSAAVLMLQPWA